MTGLPAEVHERWAQSTKALGWRADHLTDPDRDRLWRAFRIGALWKPRGIERAAIRRGLDDAERTLPFPDEVP